MSWQILLTISILTNTISVLLQRVLIRADKSDPIAYSIVFQLLTGVCIGIYAVFHGFSTPDLVPLIPNLLLMTLLYGVGTICVFTALKTGDVSEFTIIFASRALWTIVGAVLFLSEHVSSRQILGTVFIIISIVLVSWNSKRITLKKNIIVSLLAAIIFGLAFTNDAFILGDFDVPSYLTLAFTFPALAVWVVYPKSTLNMKPFLEMKTMLKLCVLALLYAVSAISIFTAYQVGQNAAQIAPLSQISAVFVVLLSVIFLKERADLIKKLFGAIISFAGVVLVK